MASARRRLAAVLALLLGGPAIAFAQSQVPPSQVNVIPEPLSVAAAADPTPVAISDGETIFAPAGDAAALGVARYLSDLVLRTRGLTLKVAAGRRPRPIVRRSSSRGGPGSATRPMRSMSSAARRGSPPPATPGCSTAR